MTLWIIDPKDPLIVRDGRPFHATPGARARSLPFPFPSTTTGGARTRAGLVNGRFDKSKIAQVKALAVRGPFLVEWLDDKQFQFMAPAPADALLFATGTGLLERKWLRPVDLETGVKSDLPAELSYCVGLPQPDSRKPAKKPLVFWYWQTFEQWLMQPGDDEMPIEAAKLGHAGPQPDRRVHVGIDPATFTSQDGDLFLTSGLTFWHSPDLLSETKKLGLAVDVADQNGLTIDEGFAHLGGERRLMNWRKVNAALPTAPENLVSAIKKNEGYCRLILLTPAYFEEGWLPKNFAGAADATVTPKAAAVPNPAVVSGWDFASNPPGPKPTRRLAPAGSVYYVHVKGDIEEWVKNRWLQPLTDDADLAKAGFGITAVGVWDGKPKPIEISLEEATHG